MQIAAELLAQLVAHAQADDPNECCGIVAVDDAGTATKVFPAINKYPSPLRFEIESRDQLRITSEIDDAGWDIGALYHSHTRSPPYPSQTDINMAKWWPVLWIIVGTKEPEPEVRAYRIAGADVEEVALTVA